MNNGVNTFLLFIACALLFIIAVDVSGIKALQDEQNELMAEQIALEHFANDFKGVE